LDKVDIEQSKHTKKTQLIIITINIIIIMGGGASKAPFASVEEALAAGKTQEEIDNYLKENPPPAQKDISELIAIDADPSTAVYEDCIANNCNDLSDKCVAITGTTGNGTGFHASVGAVRLKAKCLILLNRSSPRVQTCIDKLKAIEGSNSTEIVSVECDLQSFESVKAAAAKVNEIATKYGGLDVLLNNAGVMGVPDTRTVDGYDVQMQTNHLSHFLLTLSTMSSLENAAEARGEARVSQHSSGARSKQRATDGIGNLLPQYFNKAEKDALGGGKGAFERYHQTKLANSVFMMALHKKLSAKGSKVKSVVAEPGVAGTDLAYNLARGHIKDGGAPPEKMAMMLGGMKKNYPGMQSAADGAASLMTAGFGKDINSGDFLMPADVPQIFKDGVEGAKPVAVGKAAKAITEGKATPPSDHIKTRFEDEVLTLDEGNQTLLWDESMKQIQSYLPESYVAL